MNKKPGHNLNNPHQIKRVKVMSSIILNVVFFGFTLVTVSCVESPQLAPREETSLDLSEVESTVDLSVNMSSADQGILRSDQLTEEVDALPSEADTLRVGWIEVQLAPLGPQYEIEQSIDVSWTVYDIFGQAISKEQLKIHEGGQTPVARIDPPQLGRLSEPLDAFDHRRSLTFSSSGRGIFEVCVVNVCVQEALRVIGSTPSLSWETPAQGAQLSSESIDSPTTLVSGIVIFDASTLDRDAWVLTVNQNRVAIADDGSFTYALTPIFGVNTASVIVEHDVQFTLLSFKNMYSCCNL